MTDLQATLMHHYLHSYLQTGSTISANRGRFGESSSSVRFSCQKLSNANGQSPKERQ